MNYSDLVEQLSTNYSECWESDEMTTSPEEYDTLLELMNLEEVVDEWNRVFPTADLSVEDIEE